MDGERRADGTLKKGHSVGSGTRWKKGQSGNPEGRPPKASILTHIESIGLEEIEVDLQGRKGKTRITNAEFVARRFWIYLKTTQPFDLQSFRVAMEYLDGKPTERDESSRRTPEESAILIREALDRMDAADGVDESVDTGKRAGRADLEMVADAKAPRRTGVPKKHKAVQHRSRGKKKLQDRGRKKTARKKSPS